MRIARDDPRTLACGEGHEVVVAGVAGSDRRGPLGVGRELADPANEADELVRLVLRDALPASLGERSVRSSSARS
jgi:hypothetical protein